MSSKRHYSRLVSCLLLALSLLVHGCIGSNNPADISDPPAIVYLTGQNSLHSTVLHFAWSPDGNYIAVVTSEIDRPTNELIEVDVSTGDARVLISRDAGLYLSWPTYAPDGSSLYVTGIPSNNQAGIYSLRLNDGQLTYLAAGLLATPDPTGELLAIWTESLPGVNLGKPGIQIRSLDNDPEPVSILADASGDLVATGVTWAPDGSSLAFAFAPFVIGSPPEASELRLYTLAGQPPATWPELGGNYSYPAWSPTGDYLALVADAGDIGTGKLVIWNFLTGCREELTEVDGARFPVWSPNANQIAFRHLNSLYILDLAEARISGLLRETCPDSSKLDFIHSPEMKEQGKLRQLSAKMIADAYPAQGA
ncbi:MAG: hypothetical protein IT317_02370 [Anaerolineales bacterium]|nr:hypothetical protein [Anaerolineales bacterium]